MRNHGIASFPDPVFSSGNVNFPIPQGMNTNSDPVPSCEGGLRGSHTPGPALQQGGGRWPVDIVLVDARIMHRKLPVAPV